MVAELRTFAVTVPAGTAKASPQVTDLSMPPRVVRWVRWRVPPGPSGTVGFALGAAGTRVLPFGADQWVVADNEWDRWDLENQLDSGAWQLQAYNAGVYDHTLYITFGLDVPGQPGVAALTSPLDLGAGT